MSRSRRLLVGTLLAAALGVSACGTTVPQTSTLSAPGSGPQGAGTDPLLGAPGGATPESSAAPVPVATSEAPVGAAGGDGTPGNASQPGVATSTQTPGHHQLARGVTATTITVGIPLPSDTNAVAGSFGIQGTGSVSPQDMVAAVAADVNKSGGVLGRKLVVYESAYSETTYLSNPSQVDAQICTDFRDDHKVFAVLYDQVDPYVRDCTAAMGAPLVVVGGVATFLPASAYAGNNLFGPTAITSERLAQLFVQSLMARNFTQPWNIATGGPGTLPVRLGLIHADTPDKNAYYAAYAKELAKYGLKFTDTVTYSNNVQAGLAATQSATLKFRADGITHVFGASTFFLEDAESQKYYPRYAFQPGLGQLGVANAPADQLNGALTVGWAPADDVAAAQDPGDTPGAKHCRAVMTGAGLSTANRSDLESLYEVCDALYGFRAALTAGHEATASGLRLGYEALGSSFPTAATFSATLGPGRHYGIDYVRDMAFDSACGCLVYTTRKNRT
jgi:hypothetical protein